MEGNNPLEGQVNRPGEGLETVDVASERMPPPPEIPPVVRLLDLVAEMERDAGVRHKARRTGVPFGPVTGIPSLDAEFGGAIPPGLHVVHGGPGVGKTALALQVAGSCGCPAVYVSAEMAPIELLRRHVARTTETYLGRLKSGEMAPETVRRLALSAAAQAADLYLVDATMAYAPQAWIRDVARRARDKAGSTHLLVVVDSMHSWAESNPDQGAEYDVVSEGCRQLRVLAAQLRCPVIALAERNRQSAGTGGLHAARGSGKIEYGAESVLGLDAEETISEWRPVRAKFGKNRNGVAGATVRLEFHGARQAYREG